MLIFQAVLYIDAFILIGCELFAQAMQRNIGTKATTWHRLSIVLSLWAWSSMVASWKTITTSDLVISAVIFITSIYELLGTFGPVPKLGMQGATFNARKLTDVGTRLWFLFLCIVSTVTVSSNFYWIWLKTLGWYFRACDDDDDDEPRLRQWLKKLGDSFAPAPATSAARLVTPRRRGVCRDASPSSSSYEQPKTPSSFRFALPVVPQCAAAASKEPNRQEQL